jgi:hypothetical protein
MRTSASGVRTFDKKISVKVLKSQPNHENIISGLEIKD